MSEDLDINVRANVTQANAALKTTQDATKKIGDEASNTESKSSAAFGKLSRTIVPTAAAFMAVRLAMRGVREVMQEISAASGPDSMVGGKLKEAAMSAQYSINSLGDSFDQFKQTAAAAIAPVVGLFAQDLGKVIRDSTDSMKSSNELTENAAVAYGILKTVVVGVFGEVKMVWGILQGVLAGLMNAVGKIVTGLGYVVGLISDDLGNAMKDGGKILMDSAGEVGTKAGNNLVGGFKDRISAMTGEVYDDTMKGFDKYNEGTKTRAKLLGQEVGKIAQTALQTASESAFKSLSSSVDSYLAKLEQAKMLSQPKGMTDLSPTGSARNLANEGITPLPQNKIAAAKYLHDAEVAMGIEERKNAEERKKEASLQEARDKARIELQKMIGAGIDFIAEKGKEMAETVGFDSKTKLEQMMEYYSQTEEMANANADKLIGIDERLNGTIEQIEGRRRAQEIIAEKKNSQLRVSTWKEAADGISNALGNLSTLMQSKNKTLFEIGRAAALAQNVIDTISSAASSYAFGARLGGPVLGAAFAATAVVAGAVRASALIAAQPSGGNIGSLGSGYTDTSNVGGPGGTSGAGVGASSQVNVSLYGERFGADQVRGLIDAINAETKDGKKVTVKV